MQTRIPSFPGFPGEKLMSQQSLAALPVHLRFYKKIYIEIKSGSEAPKLSKTF